MEVILRHDSSFVDKVATVCGICFYVPVKGVGELLICSKWVMKKIFMNIFQKFGGKITSIEKKCIKMYLELDSLEHFKDVILEVEKRILRKTFAEAIAQESENFEVFCGTEIFVNPDHLVIDIKTLDGKKINLENYMSHLDVITIEVFEVV